MHDPHEAKRVARTELDSTPSSPGAVSSDDELRHQWRRQAEELFGNDVSQAQNADARLAIPEPTEDFHGSDEQGYEFKLFSQKPKVASASIPHQPRIVLKSPSPGLEESGLVSRGRPQKYYFTGSRTEEEQCQYQELAVSGDDVLKASGSRWPGFEVPWRVINITVDVAKAAKIPTGNANVGGSGGRTKPGKKRRIAIRIRQRAREEREKKARAVEAEKMVLDLEKRTRRNREKKVKRREKARNDKAGARADSVVI
ncbi:MAG: hypothetical protein Q9220_000591 [cf. Caloplaca sp. 1 TL-2023]